MWIVIKGKVQMWMGLRLSGSVSIRALLWHQCIRSNFFSSFGQNQCVKSWTCKIDHPRANSSYCQNCEKFWRGHLSLNQLQRAKLWKGDKSNQKLTNYYVQNLMFNLDINSIYFNSIKFNLNQCSIWMFAVVCWVGKTLKSGRVIRRVHLVQNLICPTFPLGWRALQIWIWMER